MKVIPIVCIWMLCSPVVCLAQTKDYIYYVREHYDHLIRYGKDNYGAHPSHMLASVIDTRDMSVPKGNVPPTEGIRSSDRAVGGSNFYQDAEIIRIAKELSLLTGNDTYSLAAEQYAADFLKYSQNPVSGLLGWGEHLYYNFYGDTEVLEDRQLLTTAKNLAEIGIKKVWSGKLFVRQPNDPYYESKLGINEFASGLLRLHLIEKNQPARASLVHWSL